MKIIVETEQEKQLIINVCDAALKAGGVRMLNETALVIQSIEVIKPTEEVKK